MGAPTLCWHLENESSLDCIYPFSGPIQPSVLPPGNPSHHLQRQLRVLGGLDFPGVVTVSAATIRNFDPDGEDGGAQVPINGSGPGKVLYTITQLAWSFLSCCKQW